MHIRILSIGMLAPCKDRNKNREKNRKKMKVLPLSNRMMMQMKMIKPLHKKELNKQM